MVTLRDVARAAGVSPATASRALAQPGLVTVDRRERVERVAAELGYRRPGTATHPGGVLGLVVPDMENPFFAGIAKGVQLRARAAGLSVVVADSDEDPRMETEILAQMATQVDGIVLCSARMSDQALARMPSSPQIVLVNREAEHLRSVIIENEDGIRQALAHLHALGHRRIAYAGGQWGSWSDRERRRGLELAAHTLPDVELIQLGHFPTVFAGGVAAADLVAASGATAVIAHNDLMALGILDRLRSRGTLVPQQVSVVGFDDVPAATQVSPTLTTVSVPLQLLARAAVDVLLEPHGHAPDDPAAGRTQTVPVSLVVRDSTAPVPV
ncbi:LacI family DNA-binding transcriptional regulator [Cellulomonas sp. KRMCY2]|uniref:LacI family DNA-binding transcriptional regulator n=1 Tax=Cellulomonas sp. KRMCY2 TaxID=1304865 RepID=UPI00045E62EF|nr:LacI family DNA-binding transcriptional regulator [Cellulomonas sp. KRMCY2]